MLLKPPIVFCCRTSSASEKTLVSVSPEGLTKVQPWVLGSEFKSRVIWVENIDGQIKAISNSSRGTIVQAVYADLVAVGRWRPIPSARFVIYVTVTITLVSLESAAVRFNNAPTIRVCSLAALPSTRHVFAIRYFARRNLSGSVVRTIQ